MKVPLLLQQVKISSLPKTDKTVFHNIARVPNGHQVAKLTQWWLRALTPGLVELARGNLVIKNI